MIVKIISKDGKVWLQRIHLYYNTDDTDTELQNYHDLIVSEHDSLI